jgi:hypothetical protein
VRVNEYGPPRVVAADWRDAAAEHRILRGIAHVSLLTQPSLSHDCRPMDHFSVTASVVGILAAAAQIGESLHVDIIASSAKDVPPS